MKLTQFLENSYTAYHACDNVKEILLENGFSELKENEVWNISEGGKYFAVRDGSSVIAFTMGKNFGFNIVASHSDSPCFKVKFGSDLKSDNYKKFNVERYGGGLFYTWFDRPLKLAGRIIVKDGNTLKNVLFTSSKTFVLPSLAIHFNRNANDGFKLNAQTDMSPIESVIGSEDIRSEINAAACGKEVIDCDLFIVSAETPFSAGLQDELLCAPRIDNLTSALSSVEAIISASPKAINVAYIADNEEVGSHTKQGAASKFLFDTLKRIALSLKKSEEEFSAALANSFIISADNAHAVHPNHPELSDPVQRVKMGEGIVIKHHANQNYTTDAFSSAVIKTVFKDAGVKYQDFYMRSDLPCGGTLGAISSAQVSIRSADIGLAQLAMHSAVETVFAADYDEMRKGLTAFYSLSFNSDGYDTLTIDK